MRPYRAGDREAVRTICYETGLMGDPVAHLYADRDSFADMFSTWYVDHEPESAWVVADCGDGVAAGAPPLGYLLGCTDSRRARQPGRAMAQAVLRRGLLFRPGTARFLWRAVGDVARAAGRVEPDVDVDLYPAHLHIDLLPPARGRGIGRLLVDTWIRRLRALGVPGVHLGTFAENTRAIAFFEAMGFTKAGPPLPAPGFRSRDGGRLHSQLMVQDLR